MNELRDGEEIEPIGELAKSLGLTTRTLRYWEEVGIIESMQRPDGATRGYTPYYVRRIKFIMRRLQSPKNARMSIVSDS